jgi:hypothetical protein
MTLACALSAGVSIRRAAALTDGLHIPLRTLQRWRRWWLAEFVQTPFWRGKRALFMPTVEESSLPESLRPRFQAEGAWGPWPRLLRFLMPLTSQTANTFGDGR